MVSVFKMGVRQSDMNEHTQFAQPPILTFGDVA